MTAATWLAIAVLGPGALAVFAWFLTDVGRILNGDSGQRTTARTDLATKSDEKSGPDQRAE